MTIAKKFPNLKFLAAHFGGYTKWEYVTEYKDTPNVYIDTSSSLEFLSIEDAKNIINTLGVDHIMFGTDYPMWNVTDEIRLIEKLELLPLDLEAIFYKNALNFFNII